MGKSTISMVIFNSELLKLPEGIWLGFSVVKNGITWEFSIILQIYSLDNSIKLLIGGLEHDFYFPQPDWG